MDSIRNRSTFVFSYISIQSQIYEADLSKKRIILCGIGIKFTNIPLNYWVLQKVASTWALSRIFKLKRLIHHQVRNDCIHQVARSRDLLHQGMSAFWSGAKGRVGLTRYTGGVFDQEFTLEEEFRIPFPILHPLRPFPLPFSLHSPSLISLSMPQFRK